MPSMSDRVGRGSASRGRSALRQRLRASWLYDFYWGLRRPGSLERRSAEAAFYRSLLPGLSRRDLIFDIGANCGYKTGIFLRLGASVVAVEPDRDSRTAIEQKFCWLRLGRSRVSVVGCAVAATAASAAMFLDAPGSALNTLSTKWAGALAGRFGPAQATPRIVEVETTTIEDLVARFGTPRFIKIDVEGYELEALRGMRRAVPLLSFEVNLPEFAAEAAECLAALESLSPEGEFNYTADCSLGLALPQWVPAPRMAALLSACREPSIEIFARPRAG